MSNPLVTIDSFSLDKNLNIDSPNNLNTGRLVLKFYIRGSSKSDKDYLLDAFNKRKEELSEKISTAIKNCDMNSSCVQGEELQRIQTKFTQFSTSFSDALSVANINNTEAVYMIGQQIQSLKAIASEFENIK